MKKQILWTFISFFFIFYNVSYSQNDKDTTIVKKVSVLFRSQEILPLKLSFSIKDMKKKTNDSTYIKSDLFYINKDKNWDTIEVSMRARGNFRLQNCYFPPVKLKIDKSERKGTLFKGNKKLKLVLPCLLNRDKNDYIIKEYMAYKLFEIVSPYYFNTRLVDLEFTEIKNKKTKNHKLKAILIEDDKKIAKRFDGKVLDRNVHPLGQESVASCRNSFFQFMIGNVDYSTMVQHNEKLLFINNKFMPLPYDFDISGLVNCSYGVVSVVNDEPLVSSITERLYRGFERDPAIIAQVRQEFIDKKVEILDRIDSLELFFESPGQFSAAKKFISSFFDIIENDKKFEKEIIKKLRTK